MNKAKYYLSVLVAVAAIGTAAFMSAGAQSNPPFGPVNGGPQNNPYVPAHPTPMALEYVAPSDVAGLLGTTCYTPMNALFDTQSSNLWYCQSSPTGQRTSVGTWQILSGRYGLNSGSQTIASAAALPIAFATTIVTGTTATTSFVPIAGLLAGGSITVITNSSITNDFPTGNNITGTSTGVTTVAGAGYSFYFDGTNFHYRP